MKLIDNKFYIPDNMEQYLGENNTLPENLVIEWCKENIDSSKVFIDIGAHIGTYTWSIAPYCKEVIAFEPTKHNYNILCGNIALANLSHKVTTYNTPLSYQEKECVFYERDEDGGTNGLATPYLEGSDDSYKITTKTLDSFVIENIGLIKIDVEGHEYEVLQGAKRTIIQNGYPPILFECWNIPELKEKLFIYLQDMGYSVSNASSPEMYIAYKEKQ